MAALMTVSEVARALGCSRSKLYREMRHDLPWIRVGHSLRLHRHDLNAWLNAHREPERHAA